MLSSPHPTPPTPTPRPPSQVAAQYFKKDGEEAKDSGDDGGVEYESDVGAGTTGWRKADDATVEPSSGVGGMKPAKKRVRRVYKTAADVKREAATAAGPGPILDMRGKTVRVVTTSEDGVMTGLGDGDDSGSEAEGKGGLGGGGKRWAGAAMEAEWCRAGLPLRCLLVLARPWTCVCVSGVGWGGSCGAFEKRAGSGRASAVWFCSRGPGCCVILQHPPGWAAQWPRSCCTTPSSWHSWRR